MRVILCCGARDWDDLDKVCTTLEHEHKKHKVDYVIEGGQKWAEESGGFNQYTGRCYGADYQSKQVAMKLGIQVIECPANWDFYKKAAGPIRNQKQLELLNLLSGVSLTGLENEDCDAEVLAFHSDIKNSKGTKDMVNRAKKAGVKVRIVK